MGLAGLDDQECSMTEGGTWRDYFRDLAKRDVQQNRALLKYTAENGETMVLNDVCEVKNDPDRECRTVLETLMGQ